MLDTGSAALGVATVTERLFVYGTLAPGRPNEHILAPLSGTWEPATMRGTLIAEGWGAAAGYPGIVPDATCEPVPGFVFKSADLAQHWSRLDAFEGDGYERRVETATLANGDAVEVFVYALTKQP